MYETKRLGYATEPMGGIRGLFFSSSRRVVNRVTEKGLVRQGLTKKFKTFETSLDDDFIIN